MRPGYRLLYVLTSKLLDADPTFQKVNLSSGGTTSKLVGLLSQGALIATLVLSAPAQTSFQQTAAQTPSFQGLGQMPGAMRGAGTFAVSISNDGSTNRGLRVGVTKWGNDVQFFG